MRTTLSGKAPATTARYARSRSWVRNRSDSVRLDSSVFAKTRRPLVSRSMRCTTKTGAATRASFQQ